MSPRIALLLVLLPACGLLGGEPADTAASIANALAPLLPVLTANYETSGRACIAAATKRTEADACLRELRSVWSVWDALEPLRAAMDELVAVEARWQQQSAERWPDPRCELPDAGKDATP